MFIIFEFMYVIFIFILHIPYNFHSPLIPHFCSFALAKLMIWHKDTKSAHGLLNGLQDGEVWKWIDRQWREFGRHDKYARPDLSQLGVNFLLQQ